jgi:hypothetical protein
MKHSPQPRIDPSTLERYSCECGGTTFVKVNRYFNVPLMLQAMVQNNDTLVIQMDMCLACNKVYTGPQAMKVIISEVGVEKMLASGKTANYEGETQCSNTNTKSSISTSSESEKTEPTSMKII